MSMKFHAAVDGFPVIEMVPSADGSKMVKATITQARKLMLLPSLTSIIDVDKDALTDWQINQAIRRCAILPYRGGFDPVSHLIDEEEYKEYQDEIRGQMSDEVGVWADDGKEVHAGVERYFEGKDYGKHAGVLGIIEKLSPRLKELGVVKVIPERTIGGPEFGLVGTPDLPGFDESGNLIWIGDVKRKSEKQFRIKNTETSLGPNYCLQLGGYLRLLRRHHESDARPVQLDQILSCRETNECKIVPYEDGDRWSDAFHHHARSWFLRKNWTPWKDWEERKDEITKLHRQLIAVNRGLA